MRFSFVLAAVAAHKLRFTDWFASEENTSVSEKLALMQKEDTQLFSDMDKKLEQADRNARQGELGRTLAMNKINEIKLQLGQFRKNFEQEADNAVTNKASEEDVPVFTLAQKKSNVQELEKKARDIKSRIPKV